MQNDENNNENKYEISVVIPCLNEENTVGLCIKKAIETLKNNNINGEIIISDSRSSDNSVKFIAAGMEFATEIIVEFLLNKFKIVEIPARLYKIKKKENLIYENFEMGARIFLYLKSVFLSKLNC